MGISRKYNEYRLQLFMQTLLANANWGISFCFFLLRLNAIFNNISVISQRLILLVGEAGVPYNVQCDSSAPFAV